MIAEVAMVRRSSAEPVVGRKFVDAVRALSSPLRSKADLDPLMERIGDARVVLLGEASHGTSEFYMWRGDHAPAH
jgi:erythromycin esterase-like protein